MTTSTTMRPRQPINVILPDHTIVLVWLIKIEAIRQFSITDMKQAEVEHADFDAVILAKQAKHLPDFAGATFEHSGNSYVIDAVAHAVGDSIKGQSMHLKNVFFTARSFFPQ